MNKHNVRTRGTENAHEHAEVEQDSGKVCVWCAISVNGVIGPYYFDEPTLTGAHKLHLLRSFFLPMLQTSPPEKIILQNGALSHYNSEV